MLVCEKYFCDFKWNGMGVQLLEIVAVSPDVVYVPLKAMQRSLIHDFVGLLEDNSFSRMQKLNSLMLTCAV